MVDLVRTARLGFPAGSSAVDQRTFLPRGILREAWNPALRRMMMAEKAEVRVRRVYETPEEDDGTRVLVDRIWPRGLAKARADIDEWCKQVAPSTELRKWYSHDPARFEEFTHLYHAELRQPERSTALAHLRELAKNRPLTLLTATKQPEISEAEVLAQMLRR